LAISLHTTWKNFSFLLVLFIHWTCNDVVARQLTIGADSLSGTDTAYIADYKDLLTVRVFLVPRKSLSLPRMFPEELALQGFTNGSGWGYR
jgi:hypothetical protein